MMPGLLSDRYAVRFLDALIAPLRQHVLLGALCRRELATRYRDSFLGTLWMVITPLMLLGMYTFVFGVIFRSRWTGMGDTGNGIASYAIVLFVGLLLHGLMVETMGRAPRLMLEDPNYVTKVVFPLEILGWANMLTALVHFAIGLALLVIVMAFLMPAVYWTALWLPLIVAPYMLYLLGLAWILSAVGVYMRDLNQFMTIVISLMLFLSPIFYPREKAPAGLGMVLAFNPLTIPVEQARRVLFQGLRPDLWALFWYGVIGLGVYVLGLAIFQVLRRGFSDVM